MVKVVCDINGNALMFSRSPIPYPQFDPYYQVFEGIGVFAFTREFLLRCVSLPKTPLSLTEAIEEQYLETDLGRMNLVVIPVTFKLMHEHNRAMRGGEILARLMRGDSCALITDAGMPAISDPGADLVRLCAESGVPVTVVPVFCLDRVRPWTKQWQK